MEEKFEEFKRQLEATYRFDRREFGKIILISSLALLVVSVHSALLFGESADQLRKVNNDFTKVKAMMEGESFNESLQALESLRTTDIGDRFTTVATAFQGVDASFESMEKAEEDMSENAEMYRWLVLLSIVGAVTGGTLMRI